MATEADEQGDVGYQALTGATQYVIFDQGITGNPDTPYKDVRVREAMQLAVDYDLINQRLYDGVGVTTSAMVPLSRSCTDGLDGPPFDPGRAAALVQELKNGGSWDGQVNLLIANSPEAIEMGVLFEAMWEAVGMNVAVESTPESYHRVTLEPNFEVATQGAAVLNPAPWTALNTLASDSPRSRDGFADPAMDAALTELRAASNNEEIIAALEEFARGLERDVPVHRVQPRHLGRPRAGRRPRHGVRPRRDPVLHEGVERLRGGSTSVRARGGPTPSPGRRRPRPSARSGR